VLPVHLFGQPAYVRLATISVSHLYNLRAQPLYQLEPRSLDPSEFRLALDDALAP